MRAFAFLAAAAAVAAGPADIPTVPICTTGANKGTCYQMPIGGQGSCCGAYNISSWLSAGGIHIDTSCDYGSQPTISQAVVASGIPREKLWITSKINVESCATNMTQALYDLVLNPLQMQYVDLLLLHHAGRWVSARVGGERGTERVGAGARALTQTTRPPAIPSLPPALSPPPPPQETDNNPHPPCFDLTKANAQGTYYNCRLQTVQAYEAIVAQGLARTWGVSNWQVRDLEQMYAAYGCKSAEQARRPPRATLPQASPRVQTPFPRQTTPPSTRLSTTRGGARARSWPSATSTASSSRPTRPSATATARTCATRPSSRSSRSSTASRSARSS